MPTPTWPPSHTGGKDVSGTLGQLRPATDKAKQAVETVLHVTRPPTSPGR
ncbi:hypothetical protein ACFSNO_04655 [Streptomyces cirratus]